PDDDPAIRAPVVAPLASVVAPVVPAVAAIVEAQGLAPVAAVAVVLAVAVAAVVATVAAVMVAAGRGGRQGNRSDGKQESRKLQGDGHAAFLHVCAWGEHGPARLNPVPPGPVPRPGVQPSASRRQPAPAAIIGASPSLLPPASSAGAAGFTLPVLRRPVPPELPCRNTSTP